MAQLNVQVTPEFEEALEKLMRLRRLPSKSEAVRLAVREAAERAGAVDRLSLDDLYGALADAPRNPSPQFQGHDDLWEAD